MKPRLREYAIRILNEIGVTAGEESTGKQFVSNQITTKEYNVSGVKVTAKVTDFGNTCRAEVNFTLPENGVTAQAFMDHCATLENIPKNHGHKYCCGPRYRDYAGELRGKTTEVFSPWNNNFFTIWSEKYPTDEIEEAVTNCIALAKQFTDHLPDLPSLKFWKTTDKEVITKAEEIVENAALQETDCDRETKAHLIMDKHSFFKGWFFPFSNCGKGAFDTQWPASVESAARKIGIEGSFEYAVASILLENPEYIAKARKACRIRKETITRKY